MYRRAAAGVKFGLDNMQAAAELLGRPHARMRHVVVAGTNGKGSTSALIADSSRRAGYRVGHYTSPHLLRFTERIRIAGHELAESRVPLMYERIAAIEPRLAQPLTFFEIATLMAFMAFAEDKVELAVLEVGLGGRLDAVNVVDRVLSVITPIGIDHEHQLGPTLSAIATEKAGIIQRGVTVVSAPQEHAAWDVIEAQARTMSAPLIKAPPFPSTSPPGAYQRVNVATAAAALEVLGGMGFAGGGNHLPAACDAFNWPGRYQWRGDVLLDGAHNGHGVAALLTSLDGDARARGRPMHLIATVLSDKDPAIVLEPLAGRASSVRLTTVGSARGRSSSELGTLGYPVAAGMTHALADAGRLARKDGGYVLVAGSLFLVADAIAVLTGAPRDPPTDG